MGPNFRWLLTFFALFSLLQSIGSTPVISEIPATHITLAEFPRISTDFYIKGRDVEVSSTVILDVATVQELMAQKLDYLTIILPYPSTVVIFLPDPSGWMENYTSIFDRENETEIKVSLDGLSEPTSPEDPFYGFTLQYTLARVVKRSLLPIRLSVKHTLNLETPYIVELETLTVRVWTTMPSWLKLISSNIHYEEARVFNWFPVRYKSSFSLFQSFPDVPLGSMSLSIEWRPLNPIEMYLRGLWGTASLYPLYLAVASLVSLALRLHNPSLVMGGSLGLLCAFLAYSFTIPIVYWIPPVLMVLGQFFHIPLAYYLTKRLLKRPEAVEVALRSSLYSAIMLFIPLLYSYAYYSL